MGQDYHCVALRITMASVNVITGNPHVATWVFVTKAVALDAVWIRWPLSAVEI